MQLSAAAADIVADESGLLGIREGPLYVMNCEIILVTDIQVTLLRTYSQRTDRKSLDHAVRVTFENRSVHERARVSLITVAGYVFREIVIAKRRAPLAACRKTGSAAASKSRSLHLSDDLFRRHRQGFLKPLITPVRNIILYF